jgi:hypothetical protein
MCGLLIVGGLAPLGILPLIRAEGWPPGTAWVLAGVSAFMLVYALTLLPTRLVISDEGVYQKLLFSESRLRWEDMVEWRHSDGGQKFEVGEFKERTKSKWHLIEFWVKDKTGKRHYFKRWLVFGRRSQQVAEIMRERGIEGG